MNPVKNIARSGKLPSQAMGWHFHNVKAEHFLENLERIGWGREWVWVQQMWKRLHSRVVLLRWWNYSVSEFWQKTKAGDMESLKQPELGEWHGSWIGECPKAVMLTILLWHRFPSSLMGIVLFKQHTILLWKVYKDS